MVDSFGLYFGLKSWSVKHDLAALKLGQERVNCVFAQRFNKTTTNEKEQYFRLSKRQPEIRLTEKYNKTFIYFLLCKKKNSGLNKSMSQIPTVKRSRQTNAAHVLIFAIFPFSTCFISYFCFALPHRRSTTISLQSKLIVPFCFFLYELKYLEGNITPSWISKLGNAEAYMPRGCSPPQFWKISGKTLMIGAKEHGIIIFRIRLL